MTLNAKEYDLLTKIAKQSKMDCWFLIQQDPRGTDYVLDLENNKRISIKRGLKVLLEGIEGMEAEYMNEQEMVTMIQLLASLI